MKLVDFGFLEVCLWFVLEIFYFPGKTCIISPQILFIFQNGKENKLLWVSGTGRLQYLYTFWGHLSIGLGVWNVLKRKVVLVSLFIFRLTGRF